MRFAGLVELLNAHGLMALKNRDGGGVLLQREEPFCFGGQTFSKVIPGGDNFKTGYLKSEAP